VETINKVQQTAEKTAHYVMKLWREAELSYIVVITILNAGFNAVFHESEHIYCEHAATAVDGSARIVDSAPTHRVTPKI
jgi:hypothetical protein